MMPLNFAPHNWSPGYRAGYAGARFVLDALLKVLSPRLQITGRANLPRQGAVIVAPNHLSDIDPVLVGYAALRPLCFMAKRELFDIPLLGPLMRFAHAFPVDPGMPDRAALRMAQEQLELDRPLVIFPEGRCAPDGKLQPLLPGVALLAQKCQVPVVPVSLINTQRIIPYGQVIPRPTLSPVRIHFWPAIMPGDANDLPSRGARQMLMEKLETALRQHEPRQ